MLNSWWSLVLYDLELKINSNKTRSLHSSYLPQQGWNFYLLFHFIYYSFWVYLSSPFTHVNVPVWNCVSFIAEKVKETTTGTLALKKGKKACKKKKENNLLCVCDLVYDANETIFVLKFLIYNEMKSNKVTIKNECVWKGGQTYPLNFTTQINVRPCFWFHKFGQVTVSLRVLPTCSYRLKS